MPLRLVYVNGLNGPQPQIWHGEGPVDAKGKNPETLQSIDLTLDKLRKAFPYCPPKESSNGA